MNLTIEQALQQGISCHREGRLQEAERLYRAILNAQPSHPDANHNLGVLAVSLDKPGAALPLFKTAIEANPAIEQFWLSYIDALIKVEQYKEAIRLLEDPEVINVIGEKASKILQSLEGQQTDQKESRDTSNQILLTAVKLREEGKYQEARMWLDSYVKDNPESADAYSLLSQIHILLGNLSEAEAALSRAASIGPDLLSVRCNTVRVLLRKSDFIEALKKAESLYKEFPNEAEVCLVLAASLIALNREKEAKRPLDQAILLRPNYADAYANRALVNFRLSDTNSAIQDAKKAVSLKPHHTRSWELIGILQAQLGEYSEAIDAMRKALELEPANIKYVLGLGELHLRDENYDEAASTLRHGVNIDPENAAAWASLGIACQQGQNIGEARMAYERALELNSDLAEVWSNLGAMSREEGDWGAAMEYFQKAVLHNPELAEAHYNLAAVYKYLGHLDQARSSLESAIEYNPKNAEAYNSLGVIEKELDRLYESQDNYNKAIAINPDLVEAHFNLGNTLRLMGRLDEARKSYEKAIALKPDLIQAIDNLGNLLSSQGEFGQAETYYRRAIELRPDFAEAHSNLGSVLKELGRFDEAETSTRKAISLNPELAEAHNNLGNILVSGKNPVDAEVSFHKAITLKPDFAEAHCNLANILKEQNRVDEAEQSFRKAIHNKSDLYEAHNNFANLLRELGRLDEAEVSYKNAIAINSNDAGAFNNLALVLREIGRTSEAEDNYKKAIALKPGFDEACFNLGTMLYETHRFAEAILYFKDREFKDSQTYLLRCLFSIGDKKAFFEHLDTLIVNDYVNASIGSLIARSEIKYGVAKTNVFLANPFDYVTKTNLEEDHDFSNSIAKPLKKLLNKDSLSHKHQGHLTNGFQTSGNLFSFDEEAIEKILEILDAEIERYRAKFQDADEGLIRKWPMDYRLHGWMISMRSGGVLAPHIHETGWLSGVIYVNVPSDLKGDEGNLVVCMGDDSDCEEGRENLKKIVNVTTGDLVFFPASLMHYTIPFHSEDDRIVLAFDVLPR